MILFCFASPLLAAPKPESPLHAPITPAPSIFGEIGPSTIASSRNNCVKIVAVDNDNGSGTSISSGTGFFLNSSHVATCYHVISHLQPDASDPTKGTITPYAHINVTLIDGEIIPATVVSVANNSNTTPFQNDFAILKLASVPKLKIVASLIRHSTSTILVGSNIVFTGYPLGSGFMLTHKGCISGLSDDRGVIGIEGSINKGNSGGAVIDDKGEIIGIISNRLGGISVGLDQLRGYISQTGGHGSVAIMGVDVLAVDKELINTLDTYISTGAGYARSIQFLQNYVQHDTNILK